MHSFKTSGGKKQPHGCRLFTNSLLPSPPWCELLEARLYPRPSRPSLQCVIRLTAPLGGPVAMSPLRRHGKAVAQRAQSRNLRSAARRVSNSPVDTLHLFVRRPTIRTAQHSTAQHTIQIVAIVGKQQQNTNKTRCIHSNYLNEMVFTSQSGEERETQRERERAVSFRC